MASGINFREKIEQLFHVSLYSNALYLMVSSATGAFLGFIFWIIVARFYSAEEVGLASAAIAAAGMLASMSYLGLGTGLIRFLPQSGSDRSAMVNTVFTIGALSAIIITLIFIAGLGFWSPALLFIRESPVYLLAFIVCVAAMNLYQLLAETFVAERRASFVLSGGLISGLLKLAFLILLASFLHSSGFGIFSSWSIAITVAFLISLLIFLPRVQPGYKPIPTINTKLLKDMWRYTFVNFLSILLLGLPASILPLMVINRQGAASNAYFYISWAVYSVLTSIPTGAAVSLFAEGSQDEEKLGANIWRSLKITFTILVPVVIIVAVIADKFLLLYGGDYSRNATTLLRILAVASLPYSINIIYINIIRVRKKLKVLFGLAAFIPVATLSLAYVLLPHMGINGAGVAWLTVQVAVALVVVAGTLWKRQTSAKIPHVDNRETERTP